MNKIDKGKTKGETTVYYLAKFVNYKFTKKKKKHKFLFCFAAL